MFTPTNLATSEHIFQRCTYIQEFLERIYDPTDGFDCVDRLAKAEGYMAETGKLLSDAKYNLRQLEESSIIKALAQAQKTKMSPSTLNKYIDSLTRDYAYLVDWCDRINRACTHSGDFQRTLISKLKEEARLAGMGHAG